MADPFNHPLQPQQGPPLTQSALQYREQVPQFIISPPAKALADFRGRSATDKWYRWHNQLPHEEEDKSFVGYTKEEKTQLWDAGFRPTEPIWGKMYPDEAERKKAFINKESIGFKTWSGVDKPIGQMTGVEKTDEIEAMEVLGKGKLADGRYYGAPAIWDNEELPYAERIQQTKLYLREQDKKKRATELTDIAMGGVSVAKRMPFIGGGYELGELLPQVWAAGRIAEGEATGSDILTIARAQMREEDASNRGWLATTGDALSYAPSYLVEIGMTGGMYSALSVGARKSLRIAVQKYGKNTVKRAIAEKTLAGVTKLGVPGIGKGLGAQVTRGVIKSGIHAGVTSGAKTLTDAFPKHELILDANTKTGFAAAEKDSWMTSLPRSFLNSMIEYGAEQYTMGGLGKVKKFFRPAQGGKKAILTSDAFSPGQKDFLKKRFIQALEEAQPGSSSKLGKVGWNGLGGEMFEERVTEVMQGVNEALWSMSPGAKEERNVASRFGITGNIAQEVGYQTGMTDETAEQAVQRRWEGVKNFGTEAVVLSAVAGTMRGIQGPAPPKTANLRDNPELAMGDKKYNAAVTNLVKNDSDSRAAFGAVKLPSGNTLLSHFPRQAQRRAFLTQMKSHRDQLELGELGDEVYDQVWPKEGDIQGPRYDSPTEAEVQATMIGDAHVERGRPRKETIISGEDAARRTEYMGDSGVRGETQQAPEYIIPEGAVELDPATKPQVGQTVVVYHSGHVDKDVTEPKTWFGLDPTVSGARVGETGEDGTIHRAIITITGDTIIKRGRSGTDVSWHILAGKGDNVVPLEVAQQEAPAQQSLIETIAQEDYAETEVLIEDLVKNDPELKKWLTEAGREVPQFQLGPDGPTIDPRTGAPGGPRSGKPPTRTPHWMPPIVSSDGKVIDGRARIQEMIEAGETKMTVYSGRPLQDRRVQAKPLEEEYITAESAQDALETLPRRPGTFDEMHNILERIARGAGTQVDHEMVKAFGEEHPWAYMDQEEFQENINTKASELVDQLVKAGWDAEAVSYETKRQQDDTIKKFEHYKLMRQALSEFGQRPKDRGEAFDQWAEKQPARKESLVDPAAVDDFFQAPYAKDFKHVEDSLRAISTDQWTDEDLAKINSQRFSERSSKVLRKFLGEDTWEKMQELDPQRKDSLLSADDTVNLEEAIYAGISDLESNETPLISVEALDKLEGATSRIESGNWDTADIELFSQEIVDNKELGELVLDELGIENVMAFLNKAIYHKRTSRKAKAYLERYTEVHDLFNKFYDSQEHEGMLLDIKRTDELDDKIFNAGFRGPAQKIIEDFPQISKLHRHERVKLHGAQSNEPWTSYAKPWTRGELKDLVRELEGDGTKHQRVVDGEIVGFAEFVRENLTKKEMKDIWEAAYPGEAYAGYNITQPSVKEKGDPKPKDLDLTSREAFTDMFEFKDLKKLRDALFDFEAQEWDDAKRDVLEVESLTGELEAYIREYGKDEEAFLEDSFEEVEFLELLSSSLDSARDPSSENHEQAKRLIDVIRPYVKSWKKDFFDVTAEDVAPAEVTEHGKKFATGTPVTFDFTRNTAQAPDMGEQYQQHIEPAGRYVVHLHPDAHSLPMGWEEGTISFENPLVIEQTGDADKIYGPNSWKANLSEKYDGKTGEELSQAIRDEGYDGIVTVQFDEDGTATGTSEIVDLAPAEQGEQGEVKSFLSIMHPENIQEAIFNVTDAIEADQIELTEEERSGAKALVEFLKAFRKKNVHVDYNDIKKLGRWLGLEDFGEWDKDSRSPEIMRILRDSLGEKLIKDFEASVDHIDLESGEKKLPDTSETFFTEENLRELRESLEKLVFDNELDLESPQYDYERLAVNFIKKLWGIHGITKEGIREYTNEHEAPEEFDVDWWFGSYEHTEKKLDGQKEGYDLGLREKVLGLVNKHMSPEGHKWVKDYREFNLDIHQDQRRDSGVLPFNPEKVAAASAEIDAFVEKLPRDHDRGFLYGLKDDLHEGPEGLMRASIQLLIDGKRTQRKDVLAFFRRIVSEIVEIPERYKDKNTQLFLLREEEARKYFEMIIEEEFGSKLDNMSDKERKNLTYTKYVNSKEGRKRVGVRLRRLGEQADHATVHGPLDALKIFSDLMTGNNIQTLGHRIKVFNKSNKSSSGIVLRTIQDDLSKKRRDFLHNIEKQETIRKKPRVEATEEAPPVRSPEDALHDEFVADAGLRTEDRGPEEEIPEEPKWVPNIPRYDPKDHLEDIFDPTEADIGAVLLDLERMEASLGDEASEELVNLHKKIEADGSAKGSEEAYKVLSRVMGIRTFLETEMGEEIDLESAESVAKAIQALIDKRVSQLGKDAMTERELEQLQDAVYDMVFPEVVLLKSLTNRMGIPKDFNFWVSREAQTYLSEDEIKYINERIKKPMGPNQEYPFEFEIAEKEAERSPFEKYIIESMKTGELFQAGISEDTFREFERFMNLGDAMWGHIKSAEEFQEWARQQEIERIKEHVRKGAAKGTARKTVQARFANEAAQFGQYFAAKHLINEARNETLKKNKVFDKIPVKEQGEKIDFLETFDKEVVNLGNITLEDVKKLVPGRKVEETPFGFIIKFANHTVPIEFLVNQKTREPEHWGELYQAYKDHELFEHSHMSEEEFIEYAMKNPHIYPSAGTFATYGPGATGKDLQRVYKGLKTKLNLDLANIIGNIIIFDEANNKLDTLGHELRHVAVDTGMFSVKELDALREKYGKDLSLQNLSEAFAQDHEAWKPVTLRRRILDWLNNILSKLGLRKLDSSQVERLLQRESFWSRKGSTFGVDKKYGIRHSDRDGSKTESSVKNDLSDFFNLLNYKEGQTLNIQDAWDLYLSGFLSPNFEMRAMIEYGKSAGLSFDASEDWRHIIRMFMRLKFHDGVEVFDVGLFPHAIDGDLLRTPYRNDMDIDPEVDREIGMEVILDDNELHTRDSIKPFIDKFGTPSGGHFTGSDAPAFIDETLEGLSDSDLRDRADTAAKQIKNIREDSEELFAQKAQDELGLEWVDAEHELTKEEKKEIHELEKIVSSAKIEQLRRWLESATMQELAERFVSEDFIGDEFQAEDAGWDDSDFIIPQDLVFLMLHRELEFNRDKNQGAGTEEFMGYVTLLTEKEGFDEQWDGETLKDINKRLPFDLPGHSELMKLRLKRLVNVAHSFRKLWTDNLTPTIQNDLFGKPFVSESINFIGGDGLPVNARRDEDHPLAIPFEPISIRQRQRTADEEYAELNGYNRTKEDIIEEVNARRSPERDQELIANFRDPNYQINVVDHAHVLALIEHYSTEHKQYGEMDDKKREVQAHFKLLASELMLLRRIKVAEASRVLGYGRDPIMTKEKSRYNAIIEALFSLDPRATKLLAQINSSDPSKRRAAERVWRREQKRMEKARELFDELGYEFNEQGFAKLALNYKDLQRIVSQLMGLRKARSTRFMDQFTEIRYGLMLSGHQTQIVNASSNLFWGLYKEAETLAGAFLNSITGNTGDVQLKDYKSYFKGDIPHGLGLSMLYAKDAFLHERSRIEEDIMGEYEGSEVKDKFEIQPAIKGPLGRGFRMIFGFGPMRAVDQLFKTAFTHMSVGLQASNLARQDAEDAKTRKLKKGETRYEWTEDDIIQRTAEYIENKGSLAWVLALKEAESRLFQDEGGPISKKVISWINDGRNVPVFGHLIRHTIAPFVRTPVRLAGNAFIRIPGLGFPVQLQMIRNWQNGDHILKGVANEQMGQIAVGLMMWLLSGLVDPDEEDTVVTGAAGSIGEKSRTFRYQEGVAPPQAVKLGGYWYNYDRADPFAFAFATVVDAIHTMKKHGISGLPKGMAKSIGGQVQEKTFFRGIGDLMKAVDSEDGGRRWVANQLTSFIPNLYQQAVRGTRKTVGDKRSETVLGEVVKRSETDWVAGKLTGAMGMEPYSRSEDIYDVWGRQATQSRNPLLPRHKTAKTFIGDRVFINWNRTHPDAREERYPTRPSRLYTTNKVQKRMSDKEYSMYSKQAGLLAANALERVMTQEMARNGSDFAATIAEGSINRSRIALKKHFEMTGNFDIDMETQTRVLVRSLLVTGLNSMKVDPPRKLAGKKDEMYQKEKELWENNRNDALQFLKKWRGIEKKKIRK